MENKLSFDDFRSLENVILETAANARENAHKRPSATAFIEESSEVILTLRGVHPGNIEEELIQVAGVAINMVAQIRRGGFKHVNNIASKTPKK